MNISQAVVLRIRQLCSDKGISPNLLSRRSGLPSGTLKSILNGESKNPGIIAIKKLCDGFGLSLSEFFDSPLFQSRENPPL
ncbi:MAG: helix-turn-helix transcriptional regulator [Clostridiales bacterium]|nr:helix-turn-helix transcriptional regulator [Clostridiales bacterium]